MPDKLGGCSTGYARANPGAGDSFTIIGADQFIDSLSRDIRFSVPATAMDVTALALVQLWRFRGNKLAYFAQCAAGSLNAAITLTEQVVEPVVIHGIMFRPVDETKAVELFRRWCFPTWTASASAIRTRCPGFCSSA
ncbi:hypothetical protein BN439_2552 [Erwinia amylovora Ea644]|uniref:hypothetical protein n=1 Tax=Erwinia amylovora TaxID=552 RepID=UPI0002C9348F|nr:hypothetical protein [Erwinia amylovora]CCP03602.1 hypothetical protein BN439_2552 [Erwinia amylovora Ea644]CCP07640.1 hypothetical protein BN440_2623 [Erwinia amylovora MR1]